MTRTNMRNAICLYPWDAIDEGVPEAVSRIQDRGGLNAISLAVAYHSGMFLLPHNPRRKLYFPEPSVYFEPNTSSYERLAVQPIVNQLAATSVVEQLRAETAERDMQLNAWVVCMHNSGIGRQHPEVTIVNAFGDRHYPNLCPAHPDMRAYTVALLHDLAGRGFDSILIESIDYMPYRHGYHHEVDGVGLTPYAAHLIGLCFCEHCLSAAKDAGVYGERVQNFVRSEIQAFFDGDDEYGRQGISAEEMHNLAGGEFGAYHRVRVQTVTTLVEEIRASWPDDGPRLELIDFGPFSNLEWFGAAQWGGLDLQAVEPYIDGTHPCLYFPSAEMISQKMAAYRSVCPDEWQIMPLFRAYPPQINDQDDLEAQVLACDPAAVDGYGFYNYGFMRLPALDWIRAGLEAAGAARTGS